MSTDLKTALEQLKPGTEVKLILGDGKEVSGTVSDLRAEGSVALKNADAVATDQVQDLVVIKRSDGPE
jgi:hypothetical protein